MRDVRDETRSRRRSDDWRDDEGYDEGYGETGHHGGYGGATWGRGYPGISRGAHGPFWKDQPEGRRGWRGPERAGRGSEWGREGEWRGREGREGREGDWREGDWHRQRGPHAGRGPRGYQRADERIREDVNDVLTDDEWLDASDVDVSARDGMVTLTGKVGSRNDKRRAEDLAMTVSGVQDVTNQIEIDRGLLDDIEEALTGREGR